MTKICSKWQKKIYLSKSKEKEYEDRLKVFLLPKDEDDEKNAIVEIRAGTGGLEAFYFVQTCLKCMRKFVLKNGL